MDLAADSTSAGPAYRSVGVDLPITLGQFLKLADLAATGGEAKLLVSSGLALVNGQVEPRRGRKLEQGDVVEVEGRETVLVAAEGSSSYTAAGCEDTASSPARKST